MQDPDDEVLTLADAAAHLGVHYMTAYRYVRLGRLPARRESGRWLVRVADLTAVASAPPAEPATPGGRTGGVSWNRHRARLLARLLAGDEAGAWAVVEGALVAGGTPADVHLSLLAPVLRQVGDGWEAGELTVADEHRASAVAIRLVGRLGPRFARPGRRRGTVVVAGAPGDPHLLPVALLADVLRGEGYDVVDLGASVTPDALAAAVRSSTPVLAVAISVASAFTEPAVEGAVAAARTAAPSARILVGGPAVADPAHARRLGGDDWAPDAAGVVDLLRDLATSTQ